MESISIPNFCQVFDWNWERLFIVNSSFPHILVVVCTPAEDNWWEQREWRQAKLAIKMKIDWSSTGLTCGFLAHFSSKSFLALSRKSWTEKKNKSGTLIHDYSFTYFVWIFPFFFEFLFCGFEKFLDCLFPIIINKYSRRKYALNINRSKQKIWRTQIKCFNISRISLRGYKLAIRCKIRIRIIQKNK